MSGGPPPSDPNVPAREKLPAEKKFDQAVYGGISYAAQAGTGIALTYWLKYGSGKQHFDKVAKWVGSKIHPSKATAQAIEDVSPLLMVSTMIMVGNTFLLPVKWLENHKPEIVRKWHENHVQKKQASGDPYTPEELAHQQECLKQLEETPKQTWGSLIGGRAFGLASVYTVLIGMDIGKKRNKAAEEYSAKVILKGLDKVGLKSLSKNQTLEKYIHVGFLDVFYSMVSAGGLYVYSHFIKPPKHAKDEGLLPDMIVGPTPATPALNALETDSNKYESSIELDKKPRQFTETITPRKSAADLEKPRQKPSNAAESFRQKIAMEDLSKDTRTLSGV